jgi:hypothetical protein
MTAAFDQETEKQWVPATPIDAIQDPPLRCRVKPYGKPDEWVESTLVGYDRSDEFHWCVADPDIQWSEACEVWKEPAKPVEKIISDWLYYDGECPTDQQFATQVKYLIEQWAKERDNGLDIVAASHLGNLQELVSTLDGV